MALHHEIADGLRSRIVAGELEVGRPLPSEARLCAEYGTSRGTVRQALAALRAEGLIGGGRGAPPVVRSRRLPQSFDTFLSFTRWAQQAGRVPGQQTIEIRRGVPTPAAADALGLEPAEHAVELLRLRYLDGEAAMLERTTFPLAYGRVLLAADLDAGSVYATLAEAGIVPTDATHVFDAVAADGDDAELLGLDLGAPLLRERRQSSLADGELVEYSDDRYRPDLVSFTVVNAQAAQPALTRTWSPRAV